MARKTDGEKIDELEKFAAAFAEQMKNLRERLDALDATIATINGALADLQHECQMEIALLKREIEDLKKSREEQKRLGEERSRRIWAFGPNLVAALIGGLISAAVAYFTRHL